MRILRVVSPERIPVRIPMGVAAPSPQWKSGIAPNVKCPSPSEHRPSVAIPVAILLLSYEGKLCSAENG